MAKADVMFVPATPVEKSVLAGDYEGTLAALRPLSPAERARHRASLNRMFKLMWESGWRSPGDGGLLWPMRSTDEQERALHAALLLCGTAADVAGSRAGAEDVLALLPAYEIPCLPDLAEAWVSGNTRNILDVQELVAAGAIARPDSERHSHALMALPRRKYVNGKWSRPSLRELIDADPGLPRVLLRMFDVEGDAELSLANADKYSGGDDTWGKAFIGLMQDGLLDRADLLDRTLAALERDWAQYRAGWFKQFHETLAPTAAELARHAARYLQLCHSRIPPTVTLALDALDTLEKDGAVAPADLLPALAPVLATGSKGQVETALKLLDRCVAREPAHATAAARAAALALVHEAAPLQAQVLQRLEKLTREPADREALRRYLPGIAASHRPRLLALVGEDAAAPVAPPAPVATPAPATRAMPLDGDRVLAPIVDLDELVQAIAYVFENDADVDAFERALGALVAAAPIAAGDRARFGPVRKRVAKLKAPLAYELGRVLAFVLDGERLPPVSAQDADGERLRFRPVLARRTDALLDLAAQGKRLVPLSTPTHRRGFIAPLELVRRQQALVAARALTATCEQVLALLRLAPGATDADLAAARALPDQPFVRALRYALGDDLAPGPDRALYFAAARIRHPHADDARLAKIGDPGPDGSRAARYAWAFKVHEGEHSWTDLLVDAGARADDVGDLLALERHPPRVDRDKPRWAQMRPLAGSTPSLVAWSSTWLPSDLEAFFAEGVRALGNNLDWGEAQWQNQAYLAPLLDPVVEPRAMGLLALACALVGKEPGQAALAVDGLVRLHADGRLDQDAFAVTLQRLFASPTIKPARLRRSFDAALRLEPALAPVLVPLLVAVIAAAPDAPRNDLATLLELLHELLAAGAPPLSDAQRERVAAVKLTGTARSLQRKIAS
jgi:hypothetical protein